MLSPSEYAKRNLEHILVEYFVPILGEDPCIDAPFPIFYEHEEDFNFQVTPTIQEISSHNAFGLGLSNTEQVPWLPGDFNDYKPDFLLSHVAFQKETYAHHPNSEQTYLFGNLSHTNFVSQVCFQWKGKLVPLNHTIQGKMLHYILLLAQFKAKTNYYSAGVLYNQNNWIYFESKHYYIDKLIQGNWTDPGSKSFLKNCVVKSTQMGDTLPILTEALIKLCDIFYVKINNRPSLLGQGAVGCVFRVYHQELNCDCALKIVLNVKIAEEFQIMQAVYLKCPNLVIELIKNPITISLTDHSYCSGYLMKTIGKPIHNQIKLHQSVLQLLVDLHSNRFTHGDPRIENIVNISNKTSNMTKDDLRWIDLCETKGPFSISIDLKILLASLFRDFNIEVCWHSPEIGELISKYLMDYNYDNIMNIYKKMNEILSYN